MEEENTNKDIIQLDKDNKSYIEVCKNDDGLITEILINATITSKSELQNILAKLNVLLMFKNFDKYYEPNSDGELTSGLKLCFDDPYEKKPTGTTTLYDALFEEKTKDESFENKVKDAMQRTKEKTNTVPSQNEHENYHKIENKIDALDNKLEKLITYIMNMK